MSHHRRKSIQAKDLRESHILLAFDEVAERGFAGQPFATPQRIYALLDAVSPVPIPWKVLLAKLRKMQSRAIFTSDSCFCGCGSPCWVNDWAREYARS